MQTRVDEEALAVLRRHRLRQREMLEVIYTLKTSLCLRLLKESNKKITKDDGRVCSTQHIQVLQTRVRSQLMAMLHMLIVD